MKKEKELNWVTLRRIEWNQLKSEIQEIDKKKDKEIERLRSLIGGFEILSKTLRRKCEFCGKDRYLIKFFQFPSSKNFKRVCRPCRRKYLEAKYNNKNHVRDGIYRSISK